MGSNNCKNCGTVLSGNYCSNCGQKASTKRFTFSNLLHEFIHGFFHFERGLVFTIKELFVHPSRMLDDYISGKRVMYFNPFTYLVIISVIAGFLYSNSGFSDYADTSVLASSETIEITGKHFNLRLLISIPVYSLICFIVYFGSRYNYVEYLVINTYMVNQVALILTLTLIPFNIFSFDRSVYRFMSILFSFVMIIYPFIIYTGMFKAKTKTLSVTKNLIIVFSGWILNMLIANLVFGFYYSITH